MAIDVQQEGYPQLPEPDAERYPEIVKNQQLHQYIKALVLDLQNYFLQQKIDADAAATRLNTGLAGTKVYYVADSSGGAVTRKLTFVDGILTAET